MGNRNCECPDILLCWGPTTERGLWLFPSCNVFSLQELMHVERRWVFYRIGRMRSQLKRFRLRPCPPCRIVREWCEFTRMLGDAAMQQSLYARRVTGVIRASY